MEEHNRKLRQRIAHDDRDGVNIADKYACGRVLSIMTKIRNPKCRVYLRGQMNGKF